MRKRHVPMRTCVGCRLTRPKKELIRVVRTPTGDVEIDLTGKKSGRGAYICPRAECLEKAAAGRQLDKALQLQLDPEIIENLKRVLNDGDI